MCLVSLVPPASAVVADVASGAVQRRGPKEQDNGLLVLFSAFGPRLFADLTASDMVRLRRTSPGLVAALDPRHLLRSLALLGVDRGSPRSFEAVFESKASVTCDDVVHIALGGALPSAGELGQALATPDSRGRSPVLQAIHGAHHEALSTLLWMGAPANLGLTCGGNWSPLMHALYVGDMVGVDILLDHGASVNYASLGWTPLLAASCSPKGDVGAVRKLLDHGADPHLATAAMCEVPSLRKSWRKMMDVTAAANSLADEGAVPPERATESGLRALMTVPSKVLRVMALFAMTVCLDTRELR